MNPVINKFLVALGAAIATLAVVVPNGLTTQEIITVVISFLGALGVYTVPNATPSARP